MHIGRGQTMKSAMFTHFTPPWPWPWIGWSYGILLCVNHQSLCTHQKFNSNRKKLSVDRRTDNEISFIRSSRMSRPQQVQKLNLHSKSQI